MSLYFANNGELDEKSGIVEVRNKNSRKLLELRAASGGTHENSVMTRKDVLELLATLQVAEPKPALTEPKPALAEPKPKIQRKP